MVAALGEGDTPLVPSTRIAKQLGLRALLFKLESLNPSGSYKDRFIAAELTRILNKGSPGCVATSSGNTGASLATYCARYGLACVIVVNPDAPAGKLQQMLALGARILQVSGFLSSAEITARVFETLIELTRSRDIPLVISGYRYCPHGMAAVESIASELLSQCPVRIHHIFVPVGGGGLFTALCRGLLRSGEGERVRVHAVQPEGCSTVAAAFNRGDDEIIEVQSTTRISGLAVPFDVDGRTALVYLRSSGGTAFAMPDREIVEAQRLLLQLEGIYCEPAGAAALAGLIRALDEGRVRRDETAVCMVTGHGFKDPDSICTHAARNTLTCIAADDLEAAVLRTVHSCA
jgi:threonine synthase